MGCAITDADSFAAIYLNGVRSPGICRVTARRRRPPRAETKRLNRERRMLRLLLVRDAGERPVTFEWGCFDATEWQLLKFANGRPVSVPRSLRPLLGRWIGGGK